MKMLSKLVPVAALLMVTHLASAELIIPGTEINPPGLTMTGIIDEVRITRENINGTDVKQIVTIKTVGGTFNTFSGGFFPANANLLLGNNDAPFARTAVDSGSSDSVFLTGTPVFVINALDNASALAVGAAAYSESFLPGIHEISALTFSKSGAFDIRGSDQLPNSMIFLNAIGGDIVGTISGTVAAVPEPNLAPVFCCLLALAIVRRIGNRSNAKLANGI